MTELRDLFPEEWIDHKLPDCIDDALGIEFPYLDKGFVQLVDYMGDDMAIPDGARASFRESASDYSEERNIGLVNYLTEHKHTSPSEMVQLKFRVKMTLSTRAQHVRHRTQSINFESHRYQEPTGDYYLPPLSRIRDQDSLNKQGSGDEVDPSVAKRFLDQLDYMCGTSWELYQEHLEAGVSRETARDLLHTNFYSTGIFSMNLRNLFHYLKLRNDGHAQPEIRLMANTIEQIVAKYYPIAYEAWLEFDKEAVTFSRSEMEALRFYFNSCDPLAVARSEETDSNLQKLFGGSKRRANAFYDKLTSKV